MWQPEPAEHAAIKSGHGADPIAGEGEDEEAGSVADAAGGSAKVGSKRRLPIRPRRHEVVRSAAHETGEEARHDVAAVVVEGNWRHRDADIDGEQGDQSVDISGLPGADELCESARSACESERELFALAHRRQTALQAGARPFKGAVDRFDRRVEHVGDFSGVVSEYLAQDQHCALASGQDLQSGHEGQRNRFGLLVACLGSERDLHDTLEERVWIRLEPHDFAEPGRLGWFNLWHVPLLGRTSVGRAKRIETSVGGDPVEPGADRGSALKLPQALPGGQ